MMERIWLKSYLPGMATDIDPAIDAAIAKSYGRARIS